MFNLKLTLFTLIYMYTITTFLYVISALLPKPIRQVKKKGKMERDKLPSLKIKLYLLSSADAEQGQDQQQLPVEEKKDRSSPGPRLTEINPYGGNIKPYKFCKRLEQANQFFKKKCDKEGDEITLSQTRRPRLSGS